MSEDLSPDEYDVLQKIISALRPLSQEDRRRILLTAATFFQVSDGQLVKSEGPSAAERSGSRIAFSDEQTMSPKDFLLEKQPRTDVERVACLAYYLTHYHNQPRFKTLDVSKLNTEAAQPKFTNAAWSMKNAVRLGYLAAASQGMRQLSAAGEQFVRALPNRESAKSIMSSLRPRRIKRRRQPRTGETVEEVEEE